MQFTKILGLAAVGAVLALAVPAERANALSLSNPGAAAAVQENAKPETTKCAGAIGIIVGIAGTIIATITVTGAAGNSPAQMSNRLA